VICWSTEKGNGITGTYTVFSRMSSASDQAGDITVMLVLFRRHLAEFLATLTLMTEIMFGLDSMLNCYCPKASIASEVDCFILATLAEDSVVKMQYYGFFVEHRI
jgi:hypothetical protein